MKETLVAASERRVAQIFGNMGKRHHARLLRFLSRHPSFLLTVGISCPFPNFQSNELSMYCEVLSSGRKKIAALYRAIAMLAASHNYQFVDLSSMFIDMHSRRPDCSAYRVYMLWGKVGEVCTVSFEFMALDAPELI